MKIDISHMKDSLDLDRIVFIGRTYDEHMRISGLNESTLRDNRIPDRPAGAS